MMAIRWQNCEACKGAGTRPYFFGLINLTCTACNGEGGRDVEVPIRPTPKSPSQGDLDFTKPKSEHKKVLHQEPYPNVARF